MDAKTMKRLDDIHIAKQLAESGLAAYEIAERMGLSESIVRAWLNTK